MMRAILRSGAMANRWDTHRIALWGAILGFTFMLVAAVLDGTIPMPWDSNVVIYVVGRAFGGMFVGASLFAIVSCLRNIVLRAK